MPFNAARSHRSRKSMMGCGRFESPAAAARSQQVWVPRRMERAQKSIIVRSRLGFGRRVCSTMICDRYRSIRSSERVYMRLHK